MTQTTGANGEQLSMSYDAYGRPTSATSPYGAGASYTYGYYNQLPQTQTKTGWDGVTINTLDGVGHTIQTSRGDTSGVHSYTNTVYAPCACSPLAKIQQVSQPYASGGTPSAWTVYTYDGLGRTIKTVQPDGAR